MQIGVVVAVSPLFAATQLAGVSEKPWSTVPICRMRMYARSCTAAGNEVLFDVGTGVHDNFLRRRQPTCLSARCSIEQ